MEIKSRIQGCLKFCRKIKNHHFFHHNRHVIKMKMLFDCDACQQKKSIVIWKKILPQAGYICDDCWLCIFKRLKQLHLRNLCKDKSRRN